jgi:hypothetical protein
MNAGIEVRSFGNATTRLLILAEPYVEGKLQIWIPFCPSVIGTTGVKLILHQKKKHWDVNWYLLIVSNIMLWMYTVKHVLLMDFSNHLQKLGITVFCLQWQGGTSFIKK